MSNGQFRGKNLVNMPIFVKRIDCISSSVLFRQNLPQLRRLERGSDRGGSAVKLRGSRKMVEEWV